MHDLFGILKKKKYNVCYSLKYIILLINQYCNLLCPIQMYVLPEVCITLATVKTKNNDKINIFWMLTNELALLQNCHVRILLSKPL